MDIELFRQNFAALIRLENFPDFLRGKFGFGVFASVRGSAFSCTILSVFFEVSLKQVLRVHARWIVAMVTEKWLSGHFPVVKKPRESVCQNRLSVKVELAVTISVAPAKPIPTPG